MYVIDIRYYGIRDIVFYYVFVLGGYNIIQNIQG